MVSQLLQRWTRMTPLTIADYLSKSSKQVAKTLNGKIAELLDKRQKQEDIETSLKTAPLTEIRDWHSIPKQRAEILIDEVGIRTDLQNFYTQARADFSNWQGKTTDEYETAKQGVIEKLQGVGYTPECFTGLGNVIVSSHPRVKELRLLSGQSWDNSQAVENDEALKATENELRAMRSRCQI